MLRIYSPGASGADCVEEGDLETLPAGAVWIDMLSPTPEEDAFVERALGVDVPTRDEMVEIEPSSRLYQEGGATYVTVTVVTGHEHQHLLSSTAVSFVLTPAHLVTVRYATPKVFELVKAHLQRTAVLDSDPTTALVHLLDAIVDRLADVLEHVGSEMDQVSASAFRRAAPGRRVRMSTAALQSLLARIGHAQDIVSKSRDSALTLARSLSYLAFALGKGTPAVEHLKTLSHDVAALTDHANYLGSNVTFLLDAVLGLINLEQANVAKIFSIAALVFLPPTLVAGNYGMNFDHMPELHGQYGYAWALGLMLISAVVPYVIFRWRGWL